MSSLFDKLRVLFRAKTTPSKSPKTIPQDWINKAQEEVGTLYSRADLAAAREAEASAATSADTVALRQTMLNQLTEDELNGIYEMMGLATDQISGGKGRRVMGLLTYAEKEGRLDELVALCKAVKPEADW